MWQVPANQHRSTGLMEVWCSCVDWPEPVTRDFLLLFNCFWRDWQVRGKLRRRDSNGSMAGFLLYFSLELEATSQPNVAETPLTKKEWLSHIVIPGFLLCLCDRDSPLLGGTQQRHSLLMQRNFGAGLQAVCQAVEMRDPDGLFSLHRDNRSPGVMQSHRHVHRIQTTVEDA